HYELPTEFFRLILGRHMKYSCGYWAGASDDLDQSEETMLGLICERAEIANGQRILDLGCGWGAFSLFAAERYPDSDFTAVSNSRTQKFHVAAEAERRALDNLSVIKADVSAFQTEERFDRIVSVEMFEHMRNYQKLLEKLSGLLNPGGKLFVHIFAHRRYAYLFEVEDETDWMSQHFFTGGMMPSEHLLLYFADHFKIFKRWRVSGLHYQRTCNAWLGRMDRNRSEIMPL